MSILLYTPLLYTPALSVLSKGKGRDIKGLYRNDDGRQKKVLIFPRRFFFS
jgi:hypothetical protein